MSDPENTPGPGAGSIQVDEPLRKPEPEERGNEDEQPNVVEKEDDSGKNLKDRTDDAEDVETPFLDKDSVNIEVDKPGEGDDKTATLPIGEKKTKFDNDNEQQQKGKIPVYLFPCSRLKEAWQDSPNVCSFLGSAVCIIFETVGWFTCVGGVPFLSIVMLIIGSIYVHDCNIEPNIPVYLIVAGVIGTIQHVIAVWTKYVPRTSKGRLKVYRSYCSTLNGLFHLFNMVWFILGCIWVYGAKSTVEFHDQTMDEYCHKTLYYFAFWIFNLSFIFLGLIIVTSLCFIVCYVAVPKD